MISRLLIALVMALKIPSSSAFPLWTNSNQTQPYIHDVLDDILPIAEELSNDFQDLTKEWAQSLDKPEEQCYGADPMASGRKIRAQRAAALGNQLGTHLSKNSLDCLVQMDNIEPHEHVAQAKKLDHPFTCPPDLPLDLVQCGVLGYETKFSKQNEGRKVEATSDPGGQCANR